VSDERDMLDDGSGQLIDRSAEKAEEQDEGEDFEGHQLETGMLDDGSGVIEAGRNEDV
jgi:hypothetical protein